MNHINKYITKNDRNCDLLLIATYRRLLSGIGRDFHQQTKQ